MHVLHINVSHMYLQLSFCRWLSKTRTDADKSQAASVPVYKWGIDCGKERTGSAGATFSQLLSGCNHSTGTSGQRKDLPVDQWAVQSRDQGECPPGAQQEEGVCTGPGSHAVALLRHNSSPAAGESGQCFPQVTQWSHRVVLMQYYPKLTGLSSSSYFNCNLILVIGRKSSTSIHQSTPPPWQHTSPTEYVTPWHCSSVWPPIQRQGNWSPHVSLLPAINHGQTVLMSENAQHWSKPVIQNKCDNSEFCSSQVSFPGCTHPTLPLPVLTHSEQNTAIRVSPPHQLRSHR